MQGVRSELPNDVPTLGEQKINLSGTPILAYTIASSNMDNEALSWFVDDTVAKRLLGIKGWARSPV